jgi:hypothetical protein
MVKFYSLVLLFLLSPIFVHASELSITPSNATYEVGDQITLQVVVSSDTQLNAIASTILFPKQLFSIESVSKTNSILNFWASEPSFSRGTNTVNFEGVSLSGFQGSGGTVITIRLKALAVGIGKITFQSGQILANDGQGTDITGALNGATFTIKEAKVKPKVEKPPVVEEPVQKPVVVEAPVNIKAPEIALGQRYGEPAIVGLSDYPKSQALLTFVSETGVKIFINGVTDANGDFTLLVPSSLKKGSYSVTGIIILPNGKNSDISNEIRIEYGNMFSDLGWQTLVLLALLIIIILYQFINGRLNNDKGLGKRVKREVEDATIVVHESFSNLRSDLRSKKTSLKSDLEEAEEKIVKKIKNID